MEIIILIGLGILLGPVILLMMGVLGWSLLAMLFGLSYGLFCAIIQPIIKNVRKNHGL